MPLARNTGTTASFWVRWRDVGARSRPRQRRVEDGGGVFDLARREHARPPAQQSRQVPGGYDEHAADIAAGEGATTDPCAVDGEHAVDPDRCSGRHGLDVGHLATDSVDRRRHVPPVVSRPTPADLDDPLPGLRVDHEDTARTHDHMIDVPSPPPSPTVVEDDPPAAVEPGEESGGAFLPLRADTPGLRGPTWREEVRRHRKTHEQTAHDRRPPNRRGAQGRPVGMTERAQERASGVDPDGSSDRRRQHHRRDHRPSPPTALPIPPAPPPVLRVRRSARRAHGASPGRGTARHAGRLTARRRPS